MQKVKPKGRKQLNYKEVLQRIEYPQVCKDKGIEGKVVVVLHLDKFGNIENYVFKAYPCNDLKKAVEYEIANLKFTPARDSDGNAVPGSYTLPVNFKLTI